MDQRRYTETSVSKGVSSTAWAPGARHASKLGQKVFLWVMPLWLLGAYFGPGLEHPWDQIAQTAGLVWIYPVGLAFGGLRFVIGPRLRRDSTLVVLAALFFSSALVSAFLSEDVVFSTTMLFVMVTGLLLCAGVWHFISTEILSILKLYGVLGTSVVAIAYAFRDPGKQRFMTSLHPNLWGLICFGVIVSALAIDWIPFRLGLIGINVFFILKAESRGSLVGAAAGLAAYVIVTTIRERGHALRNVLISLTVVALYLGSLAAGSDVVGQMIRQSLLLDDLGRGRDSGFTGRTAVWKETLDILFAHPAFGVGLRMHDRYVVSLNTAHNGYLSVLAEVGLIGATFLFATVTFGVWGLWRGTARRLPVYYVGFSLLVGYLVIGIFESRLLNVGNPTSLLAWMFLLIPAIPSLRGNVATATVDRHLRMAEPQIVTGLHS